MIIGFVSDIHEDIKNLNRAFTLLDELKVDEVICLGDSVGYNVASCNFMDERDAAACVQLVKSNCSKVIPGNHDLYAIRKLPEYRGGFTYQDDWYNLDFKIRKSQGEDKIWLYEETELSSLLAKPEKQYLDSLSEIESINTGDINLLFTHYLYPNVSGSGVGFVQTNKDFDAHLTWMTHHGFDYSFSGHGHIEGLQLATKDKLVEIGFGEKRKVNPGSMIVGPSIARGRKRNGVMSFDTVSREIVSVPI